MSKLADFTKNRKNSTDKKETKKSKKRVKLNNNKDNTAEIEKKSDFREKLVSQKRIKDNYDTKDSIQFVSTGCTTLNLSLTNDVRKGYPVGRVVNVISDYSCGKTLMLCELINSIWYNEHIIKGKNVKIYYDEPEAAFDLNLAEEFGMPLEHIIGLRQRINPKYKDEFKHSKTIEDFVERIDEIIKSKDKNDIILYGLDSLDSISDEREQAHIEKKGIGSQDYGGGKASVLSKFFRTKIQDLHDNNILLFIISQIRDNINAGLFGKKYKRSGGKALDFYCSQIIWLYEAGKIESSKGIVQGIEVRVGVEKNKVGERYHKVNFNILHGYGIDNISSMIDFLWEKGGFEKSGAYVVWKGKDGSEKKLHRSELGKIADNDKWVYNKLVSMCQETWDEMLEEAKKSILRNKKWGGDKDFIQ